MRAGRTEKGTLPFLRLLPNLVTMLGLCAGLTSIRFALSDRFELAAGLIIVAAVIDGFDGRLARRLQATSDFGGELDSLSDFVCFGVAPALLIFAHSLAGNQGVGWIFVLVYASCCCLRLARFNVARDAVVETPGPRDSHFVGVPAPAGALLALLPVFMSFEGHVDSSAAPMIVALYLGLIGAAMVSRLPTISPKSILVPREKIIWILIAAPGIAGMMLTRFWLSMILIDLIYVGTLGWSLVSALKKKRARGGSGSH